MLSTAPSQPESSLYDTLSRQGALGHRVIRLTLVMMVAAYGAVVFVNFWMRQQPSGLFILALAVLGLGVCLALLVAYSLRRLSATEAISIMTLWNVSYVLMKLGFITLVTHDPQVLTYTMSSDFLYTSSTPMLAYSMHLARPARRAVWWQVYGVTLITLLFLLSGRVSDLREAHSLLQFCVVLWGVTYASQTFSRTIRRLWASRQDNIKLNRLAYTDELTSLLNRRGLERELQHMCQEAQRHGTQVLVGFVDLDGFKPINDTLGHHVGDELLQKVARRMEKIVQGWGKVARFSGDEFVILAHVQHPDLIQEHAQAFHEAVSRPITVEHQQVQLTASSGISLYPQDGSTVQELLRRADIAMFSVKSSGKNGVRFYGSHDHRDSERRSVLARDLAGVHLRDELHLVYQPIYDLKSGQVTHCEALLRWHHPSLGNIPPGTFIPLAETTGTILSIGQWVLAEALQGVARLRAAGQAHLRVSVNVSPLQLVQPGFAKTVQAELSRAGLPGDALEIEITEGLAFSDREATQRRLEKLRDMGVRLALDDFGEGFASLSHLRDLPVQSVKLDRSFAAGLGQTDPSAVRYAQALISATVNLADTLNLRVIAEGVETPEQQAMLLDLKIQYAQGFGLMRPCPLDDLLASLN